MTQVIKCLPSKHRTLSSNPIPPLKEKERDRQTVSHFIAQPGLKGSAGIERDKALHFRE
jgi:hypothetical protein